MSHLLGLLDQGHNELVHLLTTIYGSLMAAAIIYFRSLALWELFAWLHEVSTLMQMGMKPEEININRVNVLSSDVLPLSLEFRFIAINIFLWSSLLQHNFNTEI